MFSRYLVVGVANTIIGLSVIFSCKAVVGMGEIESNMLGYGTAVLLSFSLNKRWTFEHTGGWGGPLARYVAVLIVAYSANLAATLYAIDILSLNSYMAQAAGIVPYTVTGYLSGRFLVFTTPR